MEPDIISNHHQSHIVTTNGNGCEETFPDSPRDIVCKVQNTVIGISPNTYQTQVTVIRESDQMKELQTNIRDV